MHIVTGASGRLGRLIVQQLRERIDAASIVAVTRTPARAAGLGVAVRYGDFDDPDSLTGAERQAQLLVSVLPGWALKAGVAHAVFTSRRGQVPAVRSFLDYLGAHMEGENLV